MERLELILIIIIGIIAIGAIILSVISITKKDNTSDFNLSDANGNTVSIKDYLESPDGQVELNKAIGTSISFNTLMNTLNTNLTKMNDTMTKMNDNVSNLSKLTFGNGNYLSVCGGQICG